MPASYRVSVDLNGTTKVLKPVGFAFNLSWSAADTGAELKYGQDLKFRDAPGIDDFTVLLNFFTQNNCARIPLLIERLVNQVWENVFEGHLVYIEGDWNRSTKTVTISPRVDSEYACVENGASEEVNILAFQTVSISFLLGTIETLRCQEAGIEEGSLDYVPIAENCVPAGEGWTHTYTTHLSIYENGPGAPSETNSSSTFQREVLTGQTSSPGPEWIDLGAGKYAKPVATLPPLITTSGEPGQPLSFNATLREEPLVQDVDNAVLLTTLLQLMWPCTDQTLKSDFFKYNADGSAPNNIAYQEAAKWDNIAFFQKSDIKRPNATNNANRAELSWESLIEILGTFQIQLRRNGAEFRLEHISYFDASQGWSLVQAPFSPLATKHKDSWGFDKERLPLREVFTFDDESAGAFRERKLLYDLDCVSPDARDGGLDVTKLNPNITQVYKAGDGVSDAGFLIAVVRNKPLGGYAFLSQDVSGFGLVLNGHLSWQNLLQAYWMHDRPVDSAKLGTITLNFLSVKRLKNQEPIKIQLQASQLLDFDPNKLIETQLGWGQVAQANFDGDKDTLTLNLSFE